MCIYEDITKKLDKILGCYLQLQNCFSTVIYWNFIVQQMHTGWKFVDKYIAVPKTFVYNFELFGFYYAIANMSI